MPSPSSTAKKRTLYSEPFFLMAILVLWSTTIRIVHHSYLLHDVLYPYPLGGHAPYFLIAQDIARGQSWDKGELVSLSTPLFTYYLAVIEYLAGPWSIFTTRLLGVVLDSLTSGLVYLIGRQTLTEKTGLMAGLLYGSYSPAVFFAAELTPVPHVLFFTTLVLLLISRRKYWAAGLTLGISVLFRSDLLIWLPFSVLGIWLTERSLRPAAALAFSFAITFTAPLLADHLLNKQLTLISQGGGHNFFIGHNPTATSGYSLPIHLDGNIFYSMHRLAEEEEKRDLSASEVSMYYFKKGLSHIAKFPGGELKLSLQKVHALFQDFELTNYANFYYAQSISPVLRYLPTFGFFLPFFAIGIISSLRTDRARPLLIPIFATIVTIVTFFYIARLRQPIIPAYLCMSSYGILQTSIWLRGAASHRSSLILAFLAITTLYPVTFLRNPKHDISNELNKKGVIMREKRDLATAERIFLEALAINPSNVNTLLNLGKLYRDQGNVIVGRVYQQRAKELLAKEQDRLHVLRSSLRGR